MNSPWPPLEAWLLPAFFVAFGVVFLLMAWRLLGEYRQAFLTNPRAVMSLDVLSQILETGAPGYIAAFGLIIGAFFVVVGLFLLVVMIVAPLSEMVARLLHAIGLIF